MCCNKWHLITYLPLLLNTTGHGRSILLFVCYFIKLNDIDGSVCDYICTLISHFCTTVFWQLVIKWICRAMLYSTREQCNCLIMLQSADPPQSKTWQSEDRPSGIYCLLSSHTNSSSNFSYPTSCLTYLHAQTTTRNNYRKHGWLVSTTNLTTAQF